MGEILINVIELLERRITSLELEVGLLKRIHYSIPNMIPTPANNRKAINDELKELFRIRGKAE